tara:strand:+ start:3481 stop:6723 length:3243 start_codon:yes stop_codon:yes gene_type:complete
MPRYPQGVTSFIPAYQAYQPDFTMMGKMLSIRQNQYDQNWKKLNDVYGSLLYADTTHEQSQEVKDQLKNEIDFNLRRVSGLDLSLDQNVQAAQQVFQPFYENSSLMYDMAATKNINASKAKADSYKNSADPEMAGLYWNQGMDEINYRVQEFKETPYDQIQSTGLAGVRYTPHYNLGKEALAMMEKIKPMVIPSQSPDGKYDIITTNGAQITGFLKQLFETNLGEDPRFQAMYRTEAYVNRKNYMNSNAERFGGDKLAAEREYLESSYKLLAQDAVATKQKAKQNVDGLKLQSEIMSNPNSDYVDGEEKIMQQLSEQMQVGEQYLKQSSVGADMVSSENNQGQQSPFENIDLLRRKVDYLNANALMQKKIGEQAQLLAYSGYKQEIKLNEEYKIRLENELAMQRDMMKAKVTAGSHVYKTDKNGKVTGLEALPGIDDLIKSKDMDVTDKEQNMRDIFNMGQTDKFDDVKMYLDEGIRIISSIGLDQVQGGQEDILKMIGVTKNKKGELVGIGKSNITTVAGLRDAISSYDSYKKSGLNLTDLFNVTKNIRKIVFGPAGGSKIDYSVVLEKNFGKPGAPEREAVNQWLQGSYENTDNIEEMIANKNYMKAKTRDIVKKGLSMPKTELFAAQFAIDADGNGVGEKQYLKNVQAYLGKEYIDEYIKSMKLDADAERRVRAEAAKNWDKYSALDPRFWWNAMGGYLNAIMNFYKIKDVRSFFTEYLNPFDMGKYELYNEARLKFDMPDYEDVLESVNSQFKQSDNFKDAPPSMLGGGTGTSGYSGSGNIVKGAPYTPSYQMFYGTGNTRIGIVDDIRKMMETPSRTIYSAFSTTKNAMDEEKNTKAHQDAVKYIISQVINPVNGEDLGNFTFTVKPGTQFDGTKAAYQIKLSQDVLNKYIQKAGKEGLTNIGVASADILKPLLANGLTIISDQTLLNSDAWQKGTLDPIAGTLRYKLQTKRVEDKVTNTRVSKNYNLGGGFAIKYDLHGAPGQEMYELTKVSKIFDLEHFINTGETKTVPVKSTSVNPQSLTQQRQLFIEQMTQLKATNVQLIKQVKAAIQALRAKNPDMTNQEIYNALKALYD